MDWISVNDRLPEDDGTGHSCSDDVWVTDGENIEVARRFLISKVFPEFPDRWVQKSMFTTTIKDNSKITHWAKMDRG